MNKTIIIGMCILTLLLVSGCTTKETMSGEIQRKHLNKVMINEQIFHICNNDGLLLKEGDYITFERTLTFAGETCSYLLNITKKDQPSEISEKRSQELNDLEIIMKRFKKHHKYNKSNYNCVNYSKDLMNIAKQLGFEVEEVIRCNDEMCHEWLSVKMDFEPQTGKFVDYSDKYPKEMVKKNAN